MSFDLSSLLAYFPDVTKAILGGLATLIPLYLALRSNFSNERKTAGDERAEFQRRISEALQKAEDSNERLRNRLNELYDNHAEMVVEVAKVKALNESLKMKIEQLENEVKRLANENVRLETEAKSRKVIQIK